MLLAPYDPTRGGVGHDTSPGPGDIVFAFHRQSFTAVVFFLFFSSRLRQKGAKIGVKNERKKKKVKKKEINHMNQMYNIIFPISTAAP